MKDGLEGLGFDTLRSETPVIPVFVGDDMSTFAVWRALHEEGIYTNPVVTPAVQPGQGLIRTSYMSIHEDHHLDRVLEAFEKVGRRFGLI